MGVPQGTVHYRDLYYLYLLECVTGTIDIQLGDKKMYELIFPSIDRMCLNTS